MIKHRVAWLNIKDGQGTHHTAVEACGTAPKVFCGRVLAISGARWLRYQDWTIVRFQFAAKSETVRID
jgi:hypothetical protein